MISNEIIAKARAVSITDYLASMGIQPVKTSGKSWIFNSPFREEKTASFHVYLSENRFHDFGDNSKGKNVIDLVQNLHGYSFSEAVEVLVGADLPISSIIPFVGQIADKESDTSCINQILPLKYPALVKYCEDRRISFAVASKWFKEIHYTVNGKSYFGVGFQNDLGGYVTRNALMKHPNNIGIAGITTIKSTNTNSIAIFEGYFDFLSAMEFYQRTEPTITVIILNSVSNLKQALPIIAQAEKVNLYLDNDKAGFKAIETIKTIANTVINHASIYEGYNDFNEFWASTIKPP